MAEHERILSGIRDTTCSQRNEVSTVSMAWTYSCTLKGDGHQRESDRCNSC